AANRLESLNPRLARETYLDAWGAALVAGGLAESGGTLLDVSTAARLLPPPADAAQPADLLLEGLAAVVLDARERARPSLRFAVDAFLADEVFVDQWLHWGALAANAALALWDIDAWDTVSARHVELARGSGAFAPLGVALNAPEPRAS